jgi:hypothetical protein
MLMSGNYFELNNKRTHVFVINSCRLILHRLLEAANVGRCEFTVSI